MPRTYYIHHALNAGEVSKRALARQDQNKYLASCESLENFDPLTLGGVKRTPGTRYIAETKLSGTGSNETVRLIRFVFSNTDAYIMELGHEYIRFFYEDGEGIGAPVLDASGLLPLEYATPFDHGDLELLMPYQSGDVVYFPSGIYPLQKLSRIDISPVEFEWTEVGFDTPATVPYEPTGTNLGGATLTPGATTGDGVTFTASSAVFLAGDVGRIIISGAARATIVTFTDTTHVDADIIDDFPDTNPIAADDWRLRLAPRVDLDPNKKEPIGATITLTTTVDAFRSSDLGKFISIYGGFVEITKVNSAQSVRGIIRADLRDATDDNPPATPAWSLEKEAWNSVDLYPTCGCFFQERMWLFRGTRIWGSATGDFENFAKGSGADNAISRIISDDEINPIRWAKGLTGLVIATSGGAYECRGTEDKGLTPNDFTVRAVSDKGAARILPIRISGLVIYVNNTQRKVRELVFDFATDKYKSPNLLLLADHLTAAYRLNEMAYAQEPDSEIHCLREDGTILTVTYQVEESVIAWARKSTNGTFVSIATIPRVLTGEDWLWMAVQRTINGTVRTFIEHAENAAGDVRRPWASLQTHSAVVRPLSDNYTIVGLDHLEGETVKVIADGFLLDDAVVSDGQIALNPQYDAESVEVGLAYDSYALLPEPIIPQEVGGGLVCRGYSEIGLRVRKTLGLTAGLKDHGELADGEPLFWRKPEHNMDEAVPMQRGKKCLPVVGSDAFNLIEIRQNLPLPAEILGTICALHISDKSCCEVFDDEEDVVPEIEPREGTVEVVCLADPQALVEVDVLDGTDQASRDSYSFVAPNSGGEIVYMATTNFPSSPNRQFWKWTNGVLAEITPLPTNFPPAFSNLICGHADESIIVQCSAGASYMYYIDSDTLVTFDATKESCGDYWTIKNGLYTCAMRLNLLTGGEALVQNSAIDGSWIQTVAWAPFNTKPINSIHDSGLFIYVLYFENADSKFKIAKLNRTTLAVLDTFILTAPAGGGMSAIDVENDDLIWTISLGDGVAASGTGKVAVLGVHYVKDWQTGTAAQVDVDTHVELDNNTHFGFTWNLFHQRDSGSGDVYLYYHGEHGAFNNPHISKIGPIVCP